MTRKKGVRHLLLIGWGISVHTWRYSDKQHLTAHGAVFTLCTDVVRVLVVISLFSFIFKSCYLLTLELHIYTSKSHNVDIKMAF